MRLKEAFALQNKIYSMYQQAIRLINSETFADKQVVRMYSKAHIGNDVTEEIPVNVNLLAGDKRYEFDKLIDITQAILDDKQKLTIAIERAKTENNTNYDALKQGNVVKQQLIDALGSLDRCKSNQYDGDDQVFGRDNEGKPAVYRYPTRTITTYNVDKTHLKSILKRLKNEFDNVSLVLDEMGLSVNVDFVPKYDYDSSLEEIYLES